MSTEPGDWRRYAEEIVARCQAVRRFLAGICFESFAGDERARQFVIQNLEVIGGTAKSLADEVARSAPAAVQRKLGELPAMAAHGYADPRLAWSTATAKLDELESAVRELLV